METDNSLNRTLQKQTRASGRGITTLLGIGCLAVALYASAFAAPYSWIVAGVFTCVGAALLVLALAPFRLGPGSRLRSTLIDHAGMRPSERSRSRAEREREASA